MASIVDICNLSLAHIGDRANVISISPPEGSAQAEHCARFYPIARDMLLSLHNWRFATRRIPLADLSLTVAVPSPWTFAYQMPSECINIQAILDPEALEDDQDNAFTTELGDDDPATEVIYTNVDLAIARYTMRMTDAAKFPPLFLNALSRLLASYVAGPIIKGDAGMKVAEGQFNLAMALVGRAATEDANQQNNRKIRNDEYQLPTWMEHRGANPLILQPSPITYD